MRQDEDSPPGGLSCGGGDLFKECKLPAVQVCE